MQEQQVPAEEIQDLDGHGFTEEVEPELPKREPWRSEKKQRVLFKPTDKNNTRSLGYQRADGSYVMVPRAVRNKIVDLFDAANKSGMDPSDLKGIIDFALQRAIETGSKPRMDPQ